ncbi:hypothetical protein EST38_g10419 [Candolleomyces aberdarensis]|uniref:Uncharacterized protein n=1 Tax=Candolleomyces aberdarensis TaxID=2316362 RepID=A0A4Q2DAC7_9AGAR|nr:hypothetical protein EST38_g10419 [Candolleomyces aberdarensis]
MAFAIYCQTVLEAIIFGLVVLHHLLSAFGPRFIPLFTWLDLLLMLAELAFGIFIIVQLSAHWELYKWSPKRAVGGIFNVWLLTILLAVLLCAKVIQLVDARGSMFFQRLDILRNRASDTPGQERLRRLNGGGSISWWRYPIHVLFGRKIWERKLPGESFWIAFLRGLLALLVIASLAIFGLFEIVLEPVSEIGLTPHRVFRSERLPRTLNTTTPIVWNLIVMWEKHPGAPRTLSESISLKPLWGVPRGKNSSQAPFGPECDIIEATQDMLPDYMDVNYFEVVIFHCPPRVPIPLDQAHSFHPLYHNRADTRPNLFLTANFTGLMAPGVFPNTPADMISDSLKVYLALTNDTGDALLTTRPIPLLPGSNLVGVADLMVRQRLKLREVSTFGLPFDLYDTFMIADIPYTGPETRVNNPRFQIPVPTGTDISTLRIACQNDPREWTVIQDYRNKSILAGIAAVGGLGSFLSVLFAVWFGNSLLGIVYRTKPLTPFGAFHYLDNQKARLITSTNENYGALRSDLQSLKDNPGLLTFIFDTLIDVDIVAEENPHRDRNTEKYGEDEGAHVRVQESEQTSTTSQSSIRRVSNEAAGVKVKRGDQAVVGRRETTLGRYILIFARFSEKAIFPI